MKTLTVSWGLASLIYDEDKIIDHTRDLFSFKSHFKHDKNGSNFYGVVIDDDSGILYIVIRGTDGFNWVGNIESWVRNFRALSGSDGVHNGFQELGNKVVDGFKDYIYNFDTVVISGQSQGAGVTPYVACLVAENFKNVKNIECNCFAAPPTGNQIFKNRFDSHDIDLTRYNNKGDYIDSGFFRNQDSAIFNGVDVGKEYPLPTIVGYYNTPALRLIQHSNRVTNAALMQMYSEDLTVPEEDIRMLGKIGKRIIN